MDIKSYWAGNTVKYHVRSPNPEEAWQSTFKRLYTYRWLWPPFFEQQLMLKQTAASRTSFLVFVFVINFDHSKCQENPNYTKQAQMHSLLGLCELSWRHDWGTVSDSKVSGVSLHKNSEMVATQKTLVAAHLVDAPFIHVAYLLLLLSLNLHRSLV